VLRANAADAAPRLRGALERCGADSYARAEVLQWLGWFDLLPDPLRARAGPGNAVTGLRRYFEQALEVAQHHGALQLAARLSRFLVWAGDALDAPLSEQRQLLDQGLVAAQASDDAQMTALIQGDLGWLDFRQDVSEMASAG
jgi:hypothetical protein